MSVAPTGHRGKSDKQGMKLKALSVITLVIVVFLDVFDAFSGQSSSDMRGKRRPRIPTTESRRWEVRPIGTIQSTYIDKFQTPKQATISLNDGGKQHGTLQLFAEFRECLADLEGFTYVWVLTLMHLNDGYKVKIKPAPRQNQDKVPSDVGLFSCRAPHRPNPIAMSCLKVNAVDVERGTIDVDGLDLLNDTPILDIKPYVPAFDSFPDAKAGWMDNIFPDPLEAREKGYQSITSGRGRRQAQRGKEGL